MEKRYYFSVVTNCKVEIRYLKKLFHCLTYKQTSARTPPPMDEPNVGVINLPTTSCFTGQLVTRSPRYSEGQEWHNLVRSSASAGDNRTPTRMIVGQPSKPVL